MPARQSGFPWPATNPGIQPPPKNEQGDGESTQKKPYSAAAIQPRPDAVHGEDSGCEKQETATADELGGDQRAQSAVFRLHRHLIPYPAQHESLETSLSKVCAASFRPSTVVR